LKGKKEGRARGDIPTDGVERRGEKGKKERGRSHTNLGISDRTGMNG
jgi:hypothetical protein